MPMSKTLKENCNTEERGFTGDCPEDVECSLDKYAEKSPEKPPKKAPGKAVPK
jgi:hypothetical protein